MILNKKIKRELKHNIFRYGALFFMIAIGMAVIISMSAAADSVIHSVADNDKKNKREDGQFSLFVPLSQADIQFIENKGAQIEEKFSLDFILKNNSKLRIFKNRDKINRINLDNGQLAQKENEVVLEKHYERKHNLKLNDSIVIADKSYIITGFGSVPDYGWVKENLSDVGNNSEEFGLGFVSSDGYDELLRSNKAEIGQEYNYSFLLDKRLTQDELKGYLKEIKLDQSKLEDRFMKEMINELESSKNELLDGTKELVDGSAKLYKGSSELSSSMLKLKDTISSMGGGNSQLINAFDNVYNGMVQLENGNKDLNVGSIELQDAVKELADEFLTFEIDNVNTFLSAKDNPRIGAAKNDVIINKNSALFAGIIFFILIAYIISVFVIHNIEHESAVIGTLYSMGYLKKELLSHYIILSVVVVALGGIVGTVLGFLGIQYMAQDTCDYFSITKLSNYYSPMLMVYGAILPPLIAGIVNAIVINKKLSLHPLKLLRKEKKQNKINHIKLSNMRFIKKYRIREQLREMRTSITLMCGLFLSILLLVFAFTIQSSITYIVDKTSNDVKYQYMYLLKYPPEQVPPKAEASFTKTLNCYNKTSKSNFDVVIHGIDDDNQYFNFNVSSNKNEIAISDSVAEKFNYKVGDRIILTDYVENMDYAFKVNSIVPYASGLNVFMDINAMRELFSMNDDYYNTLLSRDKIDIEKERVYSISTYDDMISGVNQFKTNMKTLITLLIIMAIMVFVLVLYLLFKMIIDKSTFSISLLKVFGFNRKEVTKLYLSNSFYIVILSTLIGVPLSQCLMEVIFPMMTSNVSSGFPSQLDLISYILIAIIVSVSYAIVRIFLLRHLKNISLVEILKDRE